MYSTVVSLNPEASKSIIYYAWDALNAACALDALGLLSPSAQVGAEGQPMLGTMCRIELDVETRAVLSGPGRGAIRLASSVMDKARDSDPTSKKYQYSAVKRVSVVTDVDADIFYGFMLRAFRRSW